MVVDALFGVVLVAASFGSALAALLLVRIWDSRRAAQVAHVFGTEPDAGADVPVFLFEDDRLVNASDAGHALLRGAPAGQGQNPWAQLCAVLHRGFPDLSARLARLAQDGAMVIPSREDPALELRAEWRSGLARIELADTSRFEAGDMIDRLALRAMEDELAQLRSMLQAAPAPIWREDAEGSVIWANRAYLLLAAARETEAGVLTWPLPRLFHRMEHRQETDPADPAELVLPGGEAGPARHFELHAFRDADGMLMMAFPADRAARATAALKSFTQTLTKTFAHLPVGLAVFDQRRRLHLFNPALIDLTGIGPDQLAQRPTLEDFLDRLRLAKRIPEPRDYRTWREGIVRIEQAACSGTYEELWPLPSGQTYRVTGRPHPDGAIAFLFEDITAEISLSRRFRSEIETGQAVLDAMEDAVAVFSAGGVLVMANAAYGRLWGLSPDESPGEIGMSEALRSWLARSHPNPLWHRLRRYVTGGEPREICDTVVQMHDGRHLDCRLTPLAGGATLVRFRHARGPRLTAAHGDGPALAADKAASA